MPTNDLTEIEGVDINCSYDMIVIDRLNTKVNNLPAIDPTLRTDITTLQGQMTTVNTKINNSYITINVKDFGAIGDGTTNDTSSIQSAMNSLPSTYGILYFPKGKYLINATITVNSKSNLQVISNNAEILVSQTAVSALYFNECPYLQAVIGKLTLTTNSSGSSTTKIGVIYNATTTPYNFSLNNISVIGAFYYGIYINNHNSSYLSSCISNCLISGLSLGTHGIYLTTNAQYIEISNTQIINLLGTGYLIEGGNNTITGCSALNCRIGCHIDSILGGNLDHSLINGSTFNHNRACGIFVRSLQLNLAINNCKIWANNGADNLTEAVNTTARGFHYGVYLENVKGVVMCGNTFAHNNQIDLGIDGINTTIINNNVFRSVNTAAYTIYEWASGTSANNNNNQICNNVFNGITANSSGRWTGRFYLGNMANDGGYNYMIKDNSGEAGDNNMLMDTNSGDYYIGFSNNYIIDAFTITTSNNSDPSTQTANIYILPHATGTQFEIFFRRNNLVGYTWLRYKTNNTSLAPYITANNVVYFTAIRCFRIGAMSRVCFTPMNNSTLGNWCISGY